MNVIKGLLAQIDLKHSAHELLDGWDRFWFTPRHVETLAVLRILTGAMLVYSQLVLASDLGSFIGADAWINNDTSRALHDGTVGEPTMAWSYLWNIENPLLIGVHHLITIVVSIAFMFGFLTRLTGPLAWWFQLMLIHRLLGSLFGLDQILTYCAMYLAITPCGAVFSIDSWLRRRWVNEAEPSSQRLLNWLLPADVPSTAANVGTRLLQLHLCVMYLFGGLAKARGQMWWDGTALWYAVGNYEYQSWDATFLAAWPSVFTALTHLTLLWEVFYCALVWPRWSRPITLMLAVAVHGGIAAALGMATFGLMMIAANCIFVSPWVIRRLRGFSPPVDSASGQNVSVSEREIATRLAKLQSGEEAFRKRYRKLKQRETQVEQRNERIKASKAKLRQKLEDGTLVMNDHVLSDHGLDDRPFESAGDSGIDIDDSGRDLLRPDPENREPH